MSQLLVFFLQNHVFKLYLKLLACLKRISLMNEQGLTKQLSLVRLIQLTTWMIPAD